MDRIDREIVELLAKDARLSYKELGERVFLSANAVADRVRRLVAEGVLVGFHAAVNMAALGMGFQALADVKLKPGVSALDFEAMLRSIPGIVSATLLTGSHDYLLRVACKDQEHFVRVMESLRASGHVQDTQSRMVLKEIDLSSGALR
ncbi:Lrp/AsnC family transcriptional regulator [Massilia agilis]|uniref:Lrp/AsnC family transcriptional regulator n=1 Tax=Massilia agilis TaxID=1811226 RepID=A0ABT2DCC4_9BURK|nr:Lrp/AsnC family transcriptional regulator [Massilia agilis]MCS0808970.1 Lrp/AsnC family transcriptional regulator [Massilia agilis]